MIDVPVGLTASQDKYNGAAGRAFVAGLPERAAHFLERWELRLDGPSMHGVTALVLPVLRADGTPAVLKLQLLDEESAGGKPPCVSGTVARPYVSSPTTRPPAPCCSNGSIRPAC